MAKRVSTQNTTKAPGPFDVIMQRYGHLLTFERIVIGGTILLTLLIVGIIGLNSWQNRQVDIDGIERIGGLQRGHQEGATYTDAQELPPAGGIHNPTWQNCGVYDTPIDNQYAVHALEHGAVWITYNPDLPADQIERLQDLVSGASHRLLSPYPGQTSPIVATAWGLQLSLDDAEDGRLRQFIRNYEQGPQTPELGAVCSGGVGSPVR
jgi:Protein of unknown function (DUF3105)